VKEIRESSAEKAVVQSARESVQQMRTKIEELIVDEPTAVQEDLQIGDIVRSRDTSQEGEIVEMKPPLATILIGSTKLRVRLDTLQKVKTRQSGSPISSGITLYMPEGKNEIDLRGLLGDEAIAQVERFLDDAVVAGLHRVDIIHGKGTGALRKRITEFLKTYPHIKAFRLGEWNEGGSGVTVVEFD
jgi:DNA mismatch repair protein MutS2